MTYNPHSDPFYGTESSLTSPARNLRLVTPSDVEDLNVYAKVLWVFVPGADTAAVRVTPVGAADGTHVDISVSPGLQPLPPVQVRRVWATGTTSMPAEEFEAAATMFGEAGVKLRRHRGST